MSRHDAASVVIADDGHALEITTFEPRGPARGVALVVPAMATPSTFYAPFATWLASRGVRAVTFDYRAALHVEDMRREPVDLDRWMGDARDVLAATAGHANGLPVTWVGHSLGGQILPFADHSLVSAAITIAAGDGYWRRNSGEVRWRAPFLWWLIAPLVMPVAGYFPGRRLRMVGNLPSGVMRQWSRWCRHPEYLEADHPEAPSLFADVKLPLMSLSFTDDEMMSADSIRHLHDKYTGAEQVRQRFTPEQLDGRRVGHHGFFREANVDLWDELVLPWLATV